jgi:DNA-binding CsgD family transcriptional regulator
MSFPYDYNKFLNFIDHYLPGGFIGIDSTDQQVVEMEKLLEENNQFFFVGDIIRLKVLFTSKRSYDMVGIEPDSFDPAILLSATHPNDLRRNSQVRTLTINTGQNLFINRKGTATISANFKLKNKEGNYSNLLFQSYLFFSSLPYETVYIFMVITDISHISIAKNAFYLYSENDNFSFRYPDAEMLNPDNLFTIREFEIMQLISGGLSSKLIAEKLFVSIHTVNTHRRNILKKSGSLSMIELVQNMKEKGVL